MIYFVVLIGVVLFVMNKGSMMETVPMYKGEEKLRHVHPAFTVLIDEWKSHPNTFEIEIADGLRYGPEDEALQARNYATGMSKARFLRDTAHGRGGAIDIYPIEFRDWIKRAWPDVPSDIKNKFLVFGMFAENRGFIWGGRWLKTFPYGDQPHIELKAWNTLQFPPDGSLFTLPIKEIGNV